MVESYYNVKNGCKKWPDCFTCPFDDCHISRKEKKSNGSFSLKEARNKRINKLLDCGYNPLQVSNIVGLSVRTIQRIRQLTKST